MSALLKGFKLRQILQIHKVLTTTQSGGRRESQWYPDYIPTPYPKTVDEKEQSARKYNLLPEEYEPYPDDENGCGDYPNLPIHSVDSKDPWYPYDYSELKKDYNEPVHFLAVHLLPEGMTTGEKAVTLKQALQFLKYLGTSIFLLCLLNNVTLCYPKAEKQMPKAGVVHYLFELTDKKPKKKRDPSCDEKD